MRTASSHDHGTGRQRPVPLFLRGLQGLLLSCLLLTPAMAEPLTAPDLRLDWNIRRDAGRIEVMPMLTCASACRLRYDLATVDIPGQSLRQSGEVLLAAGIPRAVGRLAFTPRGPDCRLRLTLHDAAGHEQTHLLNPCDDHTR